MLFLFVEVFGVVVSTEFKHLWILVDIPRQSPGICHRFFRMSTEIEV